MYIGSYMQPLTTFFLTKYPHIFEVEPIFYFVVHKKYFELNHFCFAQQENIHAYHQPLQ